MKNIHSAFQNHVRSKDERILRAKSLQSFKFSSIGRAGSCPKPIAGRDGGTGGGGGGTLLQILADQLKPNYFKKQQKLVLTFPYLR